MVFHCSLSDSKFLQVSKSLLWILADLNNAVWMISARPPNSIIIIIIITLLQASFFTLALAEGLSLESEWQQVSSRLQYPGFS